MVNLKDNKYKLLIPLMVGILIAAFLLIISFKLGEYSGGLTFYYIMLTMLGPVVLIALVTNSAFICYFVLFIYFICLSVILYISNKKYKRIIILIISLIHLVSVIISIRKVRYDFRFLQKIDWRSVIQKWGE